MRTKTVTLRLNIQKAEQRIHTHTYYIGESRKEAGMPSGMAARMQTSSDDIQQLRDHMLLAITDIDTTISQYISACETNPVDDGDLYLFSFALPPDFPHNALRQIEATIENYVVMRTLQQWTAQHKPDESAHLANEAQIQLLQLRRQLTQRIKPKTTPRITKNHISI